MEHVSDAESRPLEGLEALFAVFHERVGDLTTCSATRLEGGILSTQDEEDIPVRRQAQSAVRSLVLAHPLLRSTVCLDDAGKRQLAPLKDEGMWPTLRFEYESTGEEKKETAASAADEGGEAELGWQAALRREHDHRFVHNEALVRFLLYFTAAESGNECRRGTSAYLILAAHHGLLDGRSLAILTKDFVAAMKKQQSSSSIDKVEGVPPSTQRSSSLVDLIGASFPDTSKSGDDEKANEASPEPPAFPSAVDTYMLDHSKPLSQPSTVRYLYRHLPEATVQALAKQCRRDGIRLTAASLAAITGPGLGRHLKRPEVNDVIGFQCCVDLRRYVDGNDDADKKEGGGERFLGNLYSIADLRVPVAATNGADGHDFCEVDPIASIQRRAPEIQRELEEQLSDRRFLALHATEVDDLTPGAEELCDRVENEGYPGRDFYTGVSNLGKLDLNGEDGVSDGNDNGGLRATEYWFMTRLARVGTYCFLSFSYIPGYGMCFIFTRPDPICSVESAQGILGRTLDALERYAGC